ncbi:MAG: hypothetical protein PHY99_06605, partial [Bacteroidales bacterium]|nr:hypothetical protein [Bacteroidales bacterium]
MIKVGIRFRLTASIIVAVVIITTIMVGYFSIHNRRTDKKNAFDLIDNTCGKISSEISGQLNIDLGRVRSLSTVYEAYQSLTPADIDSRLFPVLTKSMQDNPHFLAYWISFELSALDPAYQNTSGRKTWIVDRLSGTLEQRYEYRGMNNQPESPQYLDIKKSRCETLMDPYLYKPKDYGLKLDQILETTLGVPIIHKDKVIGLAGIDFSVRDFETIIKQKTTQPGLKTLLISSNGTLVASSGNDTIGKNLADSNIFGESTQRILDQIVKGDKFSNLTIFPDGLDYYFSFNPVRIGTSDKTWAVCIVTPVAEVLKDANTIFKVSLFIGLLGMVFMGILVYFLITPMIKPVKQTTNALDSLSQGHFGNIQKLESHSRHELGIMGGSVNRIQDRFKAIAEFAQNIGKGHIDTVYPFDTENDM